MKKYCKLCLYDDHINMAQTMFEKGNVKKGRFWLRTAESVFRGFSKYAYRHHSKSLAICDNHIERWKQISKDLRTLDEQELARRIHARNVAEQQLNEARVYLATARVKHGEDSDIYKRYKANIVMFTTRLAQRERRIKEFTDRINQMKHHIKEIL